MIYTRIELETYEDQFLAPYACKSRNSKGRVFPEDQPRFRTAFQRDCDRILHTHAFRQLEYKTQVFIFDERNKYRTRLTHTLEVLHIGRLIARCLGANEDLVEAICLAHDLGRTAFGNSGETVLARSMKDHGGFDHNKQSLRILTELEKPFADHAGINLSYEVREGIVKHESEYDHSEANEYNPEQQVHLEAQIVNAADEVASLVQDLDDGLHSKMVSLSKLKGITLWEIMEENFGSQGISINNLNRYQLIRSLTNMEVEDLVNATNQRLLDSNVKSVEELQKLPFQVVGFSVDMHRRNRQLVDFLYTNLYRHHNYVRTAVKSEKILNELFNAYKANTGMLPPHIQENIAKYGLERTICDFIAGMTDHYAIDEYSALFEFSKTI